MGSGVGSAVGSAVGSGVGSGVGVGGIVGVGVGGGIPHLWWTISGKSIFVSACMYLFILCFAYPLIDVSWRLCGRTCGYNGGDFCAIVF